MDADVDGQWSVFVEGTRGEEVDRPPVSRFSPLGAHGAKKQTVIKKLRDFFERFFGLS